MDYQKVDHLNQAIAQAMLIGPLDGAYHRTRNAVRQFIAQRFNAAFLNTRDASELERLKTLYDSIMEK